MLGIKQTKKEEKILEDLPDMVVGVKNNRVVVTLILALVAVSGLAFYFWYQEQGKTEPKTQLETQAVNSPSETERLIAEISQFLILPEDEKPTVATVSDPEILKDQPFFAKAQKGDRVLIYTKAKKAILYNPTTKKVVEVAPIDLGDLAPQP